MYQEVEWQEAQEHSKEYAENKRMQKQRKKKSDLVRKSNRRSVRQFKRGY